MTRHPTKAEPGKTYPAWRTGARIGPSGPILHAVTDRRTGHTFRAGYAALCGRPVRWKVEDSFDPDDNQACLECAAQVVIVNPENPRHCETCGIPTWGEDHECPLGFMERANGR